MFGSQIVNDRSPKKYKFKPCGKYPVNKQLELMWKILICLMISGKKLIL